MSEIKQLVVKLQSGDEEARKQAAIALGKTGKAEAVPHLINALEDELRSVRRAAHECLIPFADTRAIEPLINAAADGRLDFNAVSYSLERKFGVPDAYPQTWEALQDHGDAQVIDHARPAYERWLARQKKG
jgi:HEAT repeat protein